MSNYSFFYIARKYSFKMEIFDAAQYLQAELTIEMLDANPFLQFEKWYKEAIDAKVDLANAMSMATADGRGMPSVRTVLMKYFDEKGFVFFSNYQSKKAKDIEENPQVAVLFPWLSLERQVRISGNIEKISASRSLKYFMSRPRESQLGAWCSNQSSIISSRSILLQKMQEMKEKFRSGAIPLPNSWGGYRIIPETFEFWQGRNNRLHDRFQYQKRNTQWEINRLAP